MRLASPSPTTPAAPPLMAAAASLPVDDLRGSSAMVIDGNPASRSILVAQLRDFGLETVVQCSRLADARRQLEYRAFDVVLCEQHFQGAAQSGQDLLDDLRRNQLLPFATVFIMVTAEATYAKVAEAAESALDGYLLKPFSANVLAERLQAARQRKVALQEIFSAIEREEFEHGAQLCLARYQVRGPFWLYAARVGAELLLRVGQYAQAQDLYAAVVAAKTLPWAKLGVARAMLDGGHPTAAATTLERLIDEDPGYVDAYEVLGRAQFELGRFDKALENYQMACQLTPESVTRMQSLGMMLYYTGHRLQAERTLDQAARLGLGSKMFDCQSLVLLALVRLERNDRKGVLRCQSDFHRLLERTPALPRLRRLAQVVETLVLMQAHQLSPALEAVRSMCQSIHSSEFDFEAASNLLALLALLADRSIQLDEVEPLIEAVALRFCTSRALTDLLAGAASVHERYAVQIRAVHPRLLQLTEQAMAHSMRGNPQGTVQALIVLGNSTHNSKIIDTANGVLQRYASKIPDATVLTEQVQHLRQQYARLVAKPTLGEPRRQPGGLMLRTGGAPIPLPGMPSVATAPVA